VKEALKLGDLKGNHFTIVLRYVDADEQTIIDACESVKKFGFVNYYGTQRFGTSAITTHSVGECTGFLRNSLLIGKELLLSKWPEAIDLILRPRSFEKADSLKARMYWAETGDIDGALDLFPRHHVIERKLLIAMKDHGKVD
jgi:tRNA pseudouridine13 synthase